MEQDRAKIAEYFTDFVRALTAYLRPHRGKLSPTWLGVDRSNRTLLLRFSEHGFTALLTGQWLGEPVLVQDDPAGGRTLEGRFRGARHRVGTRATFWLGIKQLAGDGQCHIKVDARDHLWIGLRSSETSLSFIGPRYFAGLTPAQIELVGEHPTEERVGSLGLKPATPPWVFGMVSNLSAHALAGLDLDPLVAARGVADAILSFAGVVSDPVARYKQAAVELRSATAALHSGNEAALQRLLEEKPWVLLHEAEYDHVRFRPRLYFDERLTSGAVEQHRIEPDLLYDLPDSESLVVEIEAASKRLMLSTSETSYQKPAAAASGAAYQIANYKRLFTGYAGSQLREALDHPDAWSFRFLLIVGLRDQPDFDERSWINFRDQLATSGIMLRTWDYYIDLLERRAAAAGFTTGS